MYIIRNMWYRNASHDDTISCMEFDEDINQRYCTWLYYDYKITMLTASLFVAC